MPRRLQGRRLQKATTKTRRRRVSCPQRLWDDPKVWGALGPREGAAFNSKPNHFKSLDPDPRFLHISTLDPSKAFWTSWILDPYNVRLEIFKFEPFSDLRFSSHRNWSKTKKQSMNFRQKHYLKSFVFCFCGFIEDLLQPTSFKSSSSRFSKILHNFRFGWTPSR